MVALEGVDEAGLAESAARGGGEADDGPLVRIRTRRRELVVVPGRQHPERILYEG